MPTRSKKSMSAYQLGLEGLTEAEAGWWRCDGIFTPNYLKRHLTQPRYVPTEEDCRDLYDRVKRRWLENYAALRKRPEAFTRDKFLNPTLGDLGWAYLPEQDLPKCPTRKVPDYCLFLGEDTQQRVAAGDATEIFRASVSMLEAKKVQHPLDEVSKTETPGWFPSQQVQDYLWHAKDSSGRFFNWAVLTNGNQWRLYSEKAAPNAYFAFHLAKGDQFCPLEQFRLFVALFGPRAFEQQEAQKCLLDDFFSESLDLQEALETNLRKRVFNVLEELAEGYYYNPDNGLSEDDLPEVYNTALIFLYRLLFILYAESRDLLPAKASVYGANIKYRRDFSLVRFVARLRDQSRDEDDVFSEMYGELLKLFNLINGTHKARNDALDVTRYNGGLFDPTRHPTVEKWRIGDKTLARVLQQLMFAQPPPRGTNRQQVLYTGETIDFGTLEVRQLGDIYEGLLGGHLAERSGPILQLVDDRGENHQQGIFYTPDWIVQYLVRESLQPLVHEIERSSEVQAAREARNRDDSFALGVLQLNVVDPAMGSAHFLVRVTEWLAEEIAYHPTTRLRTERVVVNGGSQRTRQAIVADGLIPVAPGASQEQAELAYWRRRVVESCIYGVDTNPLAVELAKLSLWLTCIAVDEPLNFLDHHLREGNSLIGAHPEAARTLPYAVREAEKQVTVDVGDALTDTLRQVIDANVNIEMEASSEMEIVKAKEESWKQVRDKLDPFLDTLDLWIAALDGKDSRLTSLNAYEYQQMVFYRVAPDRLTDKDKARAKALWKTLRSPIDQVALDLQPFHWRIEFPDVFYEADGALKPEDRRGFDAVLGNPPYISAHTSSEEVWRDALEKRAGYIDDLYVHFTHLGLELLRPGGSFGFIVSDTFFTLNTKERMRRWMQSVQLTHLGQCDPFSATVDAAIFVLRKQKAPSDSDTLLFVQARNKLERSTPERELPQLPHEPDVQFTDSTPNLCVQHATQGCLRLHRAPASLYRNAHKRAFFEPTPGVLELYRRFNDPVKTLVETWWDRIKDSKKFADNREEIQAYQTSLKPGDITLVGLIAEGGQGMRTADNGRFLGYLAGTPQAREIERKREDWSRRWLAHSDIAATFRDLLARNGGDPARPIADSAAWEAAVDAMREDRALRPKLGFGTTDLYRIVPPELVAADEDFRFTWENRKADLLRRWQTDPDLNGFWHQHVSLLQRTDLDLALLRAAKDLPDETFCALCQELKEWITAENLRRNQVRPTERPIPSHALGLRSSEDYGDPADVQRVAVVYNGLMGRGRWVPFRKGDPEGNRWLDNEPLYIDWTAPAVDWLSTAPAARWQGHTFFLTPGVTYTLLGNHVALKAKVQDPCVFDASASRLTSVFSQVPVPCLLCVFNSDVFSYYLKRFLKNTAAFEISDLRMMPIVVPSPSQARRLSELATRAMEAKRLAFAAELPPNELVAYCRGLAENLKTAPSYLRPSAQQSLLMTAVDCLATIELAVNWEAEKLYGVEGLGPFDEF